MLITIARQLGSGGGKLGQRVAEQLGMTYVDREILRRAAEMAEVSEEAIRGTDERRPSILERMSAYVVGYQAPLAPEYMPPDVLFSPPLPHDACRRLVEDVIRQVAARGNAVIVGRGAQVILRNYEPSLHVYVYAPMQVRVRAIAEREHVSPQEALQRAQESDRDRAGFLRSYYGVDWHDPDLYDLILNTGRIPIEDAVALVVEAARDRARAFGRTLGPTRDVP